MSIFIELFSEDVEFHGDGESTAASFDMAGWPFNVDFGGAAQTKVSAYIVEGDPETLTPVECENNGSFVTITFSEPIAGGETKTIRLRTKVLL